MRGKATLAATIAALVPGSATALPSSYYPRPHQPCRPGYVRKTVKVRERKHGKVLIVRRVECVLKPRPVTTTEAFAFSTIDPNNYTTYFTVAAGVYDNSHSQLRGLPITYSVTDDTANKIIATFTGTSNADASCTIVVTLDSTDTVRTYTGKAVTPYPACNLGTVSMPAADNAAISASFAGNGQFSPSTSRPQAFN